MLTVCTSGLWHRLPGSLRLAGLNSTFSESLYLSVSLQISRSWGLQCLGASYRGLDAGRERGAGVPERVRQQGKERKRALLKTYYYKRHPFCFGSSAYADRLIGLLHFCDLDEQMQRSTTIISAISMGSIKCNICRHRNSCS